MSSEKPKNVILEVVRGSQAHGLALDGGDLDTGFVFVNDTERWWSLEGRPEKHSWTLRDGDDDTGFEIGQWLIDVLRGDPNQIEFLWAPVVAKDKYGDALLAIRDSLWDAKIVMERAIGYAKNKRNVMLDPKTVGKARQAKFATAIIRVLWQCTSLLVSGTYPVAGLDKTAIGPTLTRIKRTDNWTLGEVVDLERQFAEELRQAYIGFHSVKAKTADWNVAQAFLNDVRRAH